MRCSIYNKKVEKCPQYKQLIEIKINKVGIIRKKNSGEF